MFAGHFGLAATVKANRPAAPLWALMLATQLLDVIFAVLTFTGVESIGPGPTGYGEGVINAHYTHSLVGALLIATAAAALAAWRWGRQPGLVIGAVVFSHWLLDLLVHRADLPLLPGHLGGGPLLGLGLWQQPVASIAAEGLLILVGAITYARSVRARSSNPTRATVAAAVLALLLALSLTLDVAGV